VLQVMGKGAEAGGAGQGLALRRGRWLAEGRPPGGSDSGAAMPGPRRAVDPRTVRRWYALLAHVPVP
jgi:hypothetical protein